MLSMLKRVITVDKYVIQVHGAEVVKVILQGIVNIALEATWAVVYTKGYNVIFKLAEARYKCGLLFVTFLYLEVVKSGNDIELSVELGLVKPFKGFIYKRYRVSILNHNGIKPFIVNVELKTSFQLFGKKDRGGYRG